MLNRHLLTCSLAVLLAVPAGLAAQTTPPATAPAAAPAKPQQKQKPKSKAEAKALQDLQKLSRDPATQPAAMDAALTAFATQYPTSDYLGTVAVWGLQYFQTPPHVDYAKSLVYGEQAVKGDDPSLYALVTLGTIIPDQVKDTDLDYDQRVSEAKTDDQKALALADSGATTLNGQPFSEAEKTLVRSKAYASLGKLAMVAKDYPGAVTNYEKAAQYDSGASQAADYFYAARAQMEQKQWDDALKLLDEAEKAAPDVPAIKNAVDSNRKAIEKAKGGGE
jgi:tetratricopeptide (TPR) repeat protein